MATPRIEQTASTGMTKVTLDEVRRDWRVLDSEFDGCTGAAMYSHQQFTKAEGLDVAYLPPNWLVRLASFVPFLAESIYSISLLGRTSHDGVLIVNGAGRLWMMVGLINRLCIWRQRRVLCWDMFIDATNGFKLAFVKYVSRGCTQFVVWSRAQVSTHAELLGLAEERFIFIPYKANHSKHSTYELPDCGFIFSGGNSKRDYHTLAEAVRDTGIPVIVSATDPVVRQTVAGLSNVIMLAASEPAFAQLQAAARFVVIPMKLAGPNGGGEANFCNAMWHGKAVIAADSMSAGDYIEDGVTGFVVPSGDVETLRDRILNLWRDRELCTRMGNAGGIHVRDRFTHEHFVRRLLRLACLVAAK